MESALYDVRFGYYARATQRSGRAGDFFTSVDVGAVFGRLLAAQIAEMAAITTSAETVERAAERPERFSSRPFDLVEAGAGNGRLSADILRALRNDSADLYHRT